MRAILPGFLKLHVLAASAIVCALVAIACDQQPEEPGVNQNESRVPARIIITAGDFQVASAHARLSAPLTVRVTDSMGAPVRDAAVLWSVFDDGSVSSGRTITDAAGMTSTERVLGSSAGEYITTAVVDKVSAVLPARFVSIAQIQGAIEISWAPNSSGNEQMDTVLSTLSPFKVRVRDHQGVPVAGVHVHWTAVRGSGDLQTTTSITDVGGVAQAVYTLGRTAGLVVVTASAEGLVGSPVQFTASSIPGNPATIRKISGDNQIGYAGNFLKQSYSAAPVDAYGNDIPVALVWTAASGGGLVTPEQGVTVSHRLGPADGAQTVTATVYATAVVPVTFTATAFTTRVAIRSGASRGFYPQEITVSAGKTVGWEWECEQDDYYHYGCYFSEEHNIVFEDNPQYPASSPSRREGTHLRKFVGLAPSTIRYRCTHHSTSFTEGMVGTVRVIP